MEAYKDIQSIKDYSILNIAIGKNVTVYLKRGFEGYGYRKGILKKISGVFLHIEDGKKNYFIPLDNISTFEFV